MADKVRRVAYYNVQVDDRPGQALKVLAALKENNVNLLSFTSFPSTGGKAQLVLVPEKPDALLKAAQQAGLQLGPAKEAFFVQGKDRAGVAAELFKNLADAQVNVHATNASSGGSGGYGFIIWVKPEHFAAAATALGA